MVWACPTLVVKVFTCMHHETVEELHNGEHSRCTLVALLVAAGSSYLEYIFCGVWQSMKLSDITE